MSTIIQQLRDVVPLRALTMIEAMQVAELQATRFRVLSGSTHPAIPETAIAGLPRVQVERMTPAPAAGASQWSRGRWLILINGGEPIGRQRFSLMHEFKHVLDSPFIQLLYPAIDGLSQHERGEQICEYFAACLLMPRALVKQLYCDEGVQEIGRLARRFEVSWQAMKIRLLQLGLIQPTPRCAGVAAIPA
jgi:Zn-dependent peptidase ImmA (M78 family)